MNFRKWIVFIASVLTSVFISSCNVDDRDIKQTQINQDFVYYLVTHGPSTDAGFWGDVLTEARQKAEQLGVGLVPLHPAQESSGEQLNAQLRQAIMANPPGIIATVWGEGMQQVIIEANMANIPVAAINVYPTPEEYATGEANLLLYAGQNDYLAAKDVVSALICGALDLKYEQQSCEGLSVTEAFERLQAQESLHTVCLIPQQSGGILSRCQAMRDMLLDELLLSSDQFTELVWNEAIVGEGATAIKEFVDSHPSTTKFLILSQGHSATSSYVGAELPSEQADKIVFGTFDLSSLICEALVEGTVLFASDQGHKLQGKMALDYLHFFVLNGYLPEAGKAVTGENDERWQVSPDGFPWYKTGPNLLYGSCE